ncbi:MAG TPA: PhnD/SsuA/transferrin family substrate-binding protein, partial [Chthoniobacterales bacterium]
MKFRLASLVFAAALAFPLSQAHAQASPQKLVIALKPDKNPDQMMEERRTLSEFLAKQLGKPVDVIVPLSSSVIIEGFANGTVDLGYLSATDMVAARQRKAAEILLAGEIDGK